MNILFLARHFPYPPVDGEKVIVYNLLRELSGRHHITLLCFAEAEDDRQQYSAPGLDIQLEMIPPRRARPPLLRQLRNAVSPHPAYIDDWQVTAYRDRLRALLQTQHFDLIHIDSAFLAVYAPELAGKPIVFTPHDSLSLMVESIDARLVPGYGPAKRLYRRLQQAKTRNFERSVYSNFDQIYAVTERDAQAIADLLPGRTVHVIPNGVDTQFFTPSQATNGTTPSLVFTGVMSYFPNVEAVRFFTDAIWLMVREAVPEARFTIVGRDPDPSLQALADADPGITVTGTVPDIRPYIEQATVYVCPVQTGAGIKNKVLEAMAMQRPIVATSFACSGIDVRSGIHLLLRDDPEQFAAAVIGLLSDPAQRDRLGRSAWELVERQYGWTANAQHVEGLYYEAVRQ